MKLGRVVGTVVSTINAPDFEGRTLLLVDLVDPGGEASGGYMIAVDSVGAGAGETVLLLDEGNSARQVLAAPGAPIRTVVVGIVDEVTGEERPAALPPARAAAARGPRSEGPGPTPQVGEAIRSRRRLSGRRRAVSAAPRRARPAPRRARPAPRRARPARRYWHDVADARPRRRPAHAGRRPRALPAFGSVALVVIVYAVAMAFLESAVVVYLQRALGIDPRALFPVEDPAVTGDLAVIEVGREAATMIMLAAVGWLAGRSGLERLAWTAVAFGTWDILYYAWLWVFIGWPPSLGTWDLLFLIPVPWAGPVWAPVVVSLALVGFGLAAAARLRAGQPVRAGRTHVVAGLAGGLIVVLALCWNAPRVLDGEVPANFPWPIFVTGMAIAAWGAVTALRPGAAATTAAV